MPTSNSAPVFSFWKSGRRASYPVISRLSQVAAEERNFQQQTYYSIIGGFAQGKSNLRAKNRGTFSCRMRDEDIIPPLIIPRLFEFRVQNSAVRTHPHAPPPTRPSRPTPRHNTLPAPGARSTSPATQSRAESAKRGSGTGSSAPARAPA